MYLFLPLVPLLCFSSPHSLYLSYMYHISVYEQIDFCTCYSPRSLSSLRKSQDRIPRYTWESEQVWLLIILEKSFLRSQYQNFSSKNSGREYAQNQVHGVFKNLNLSNMAERYTVSMVA